MTNRQLESERSGFLISVGIRIISLVIEVINNPRNLSKEAFEEVIIELEKISEDLESSGFGH